MDKKEIIDRVYEINEKINELCNFLCNEDANYEIDLDYIDETSISDMSPYKKYYISVETKETFR